MIKVQTYSNIAVSAAESEVLDQLRRPEVMAVVWHGAWSKPALDFADFLSKDDRLTRPGNTDVLRDVVAQFSNRDDARAFTSDLKHFERLFRILGMQLHFGASLNDRSRLESTSYHGLNIVPNWHVDSGHLALLSVPSGPTTEYIDGFVTGNFKGVVFTPTDTSAPKIQSLNNDDVVIFKCRSFAQEDWAPSFIHKRPDCPLLTESYPNRPVIHMKIS